MAHVLVFVNNVLLEHRHVHLFVYVLFTGVSITKAGLSIYNRDYMACKACNIYNLALYKTIFFKSDL